MSDPSVRDSLAHIGCFADDDNLANLRIAANTCSTFKQEEPAVHRFILEKRRGPADKAQGSERR